MPESNQVAGLTREERQAAIAELEESRRRFLRAISDLSEEQWSFRPAPDRWSIADCAEHITAAEAPLGKLIANATARPSEEERRRIREQDDLVSRSIRDRSRRDEAPERIRPKGRFPTRDETSRVFEERRAANLEFVRTTSEPLRDRFAPHPFAGVIDGFQWALFLAAHTERHTMQIEEIKNDARFPKGDSVATSPA